MGKKIDFYLDIISPYTYFAHVKLPALAAKYGYTIAYHPMDVAVAKMASGNYGPSNRDIPPKINALKQDMSRWAKYYGVPLNFPKSFGNAAGFSCARWNTGVLFANAHQGSTEKFVTEAWSRIYGKGADANDDSELRGAATAAGLNADEFMDYINSSRGQTDFRKSCVDAHKAGVFGAPIMMIDDQIWWGNDRLNFVEEYMAANPG